jgi:branched-chain amino acid transport system permease protein
MGYETRPSWKHRFLGVSPQLGGVVLLLILPFLLGTYYLGMLTKVLIFGIFAMSLDLILGYTGLLSLGHAAFLGVGGYTAGILMVHFGVESFWLVAPAGILAAGFAALIIGYLALRVSGVYFLLITLAFGQLLSVVAIHWRGMTGGTNGLVGIPYPTIGLRDFTWPGSSFYFLIFICFLISYVALRRIAASSFGRSLVGIREHEGRMMSLGFNTWLHKYVAFTISGIFAGLSGVLFACFYGIMVPEHLGLATSASVMLMVAIGSPGTLVGPVIGSVIVVLLEHFASIYAPERWPLVLGGVFVVSVVFVRGGVGIYLIKFCNSVLRRYGRIES